MNLTSIVKALVIAGATPEMILAAVEAAEGERERTEAERLAKGAARQQRYRTLRDVTQRHVTLCNTTPLAPSPDGFPNPSLTPTINPHKENPPKGGQKKGSRFALAVMPDDWRKFCEEKRQDLDPDELFAEFRDYWCAVPGQRGCKLDWIATWRNRVRDKKRSHAPPPKETRDERFSRIFKEMEAEERNQGNEPEAARTN